MSFTNFPLQHTVMKDKKPQVLHMLIIFPSFYYEITHKNQIYHTK